jgi:hypothetical protein
MNFLVLAMILAVTLTADLAVLKVVPKALSFVPEALSALVVVVVVIAGARQRFRYVRAQYWLAFGAMVAIMVCGVIANAVAPGPVFAGIRYYARAMPLFLLPAVYEFRDSQIRWQLRLLLLLGLVQVPIAISQRALIMSEDRFTGDPVYGTLMDSSILSLYLIGAVCILVAAMMRRRLSKTIGFLLCACLLVPTTINETKGTLILLPIGLLTTVIVASPRARRLRVSIIAIGLLASFVAAYVSIYAYVQRNNPYYQSVGSVFLDEKKFDQYLDRNADIGVKTDMGVGRVDSLRASLRRLSEDPVQLAFGVGIGNAAHSSIGSQFTGAYFQLFGSLLISSTTVFLLEIGLLGTAVVFTLHWLVFRDAVAVARADHGLIGTIATAWIGITIIMTLGLPYKLVHIYDSMSFLFWYFSGLVAAQRMRLVREAAREPPAVLVPRTAGAVMSRDPNPAMPGIRAARQH